MSSTPEVRIEIDPELDPGSTEKLIRLWTDVSNAGGAVGFAPPVTIDEVRPVALQALGDVANDRDRLVVAYEQDDPVGFLFLVRRPGPLFRHWVTVKRLQVHPSLQRTGVGSALLEATHEALRREGLEQVHLTVRGGTGSEAFYERAGYRVAARIPNVIRVAPGDDREEIYMVKEL